METKHINELIENLCVCVHPDADIERLKREAYENIKNYADDLAIEFAQQKRRRQSERDAKKDRYRLNRN